MRTDRRRCERVRVHLPGYVDNDLARPRHMLVERHLRRCVACAAEEARQRRVTHELASLRRSTDEALDDVAPPDDLLDNILDQTLEPGLRERVAVPARGAVSGARPGLSVALAAAVLALAFLAGWVGWRLGRAAARQRQ